ncbi:MAG: hypothetical protein KDD69_05145, partial [Bdellovibrionales bacterium]|nr:hypothetical protein [Bdellovibrionales bacterium]
NSVAYTFVPLRHSELFVMQMGTSVNPMSEQKSSETPDVEAIMARIRAQVKAELEQSGARTDRYIPPSPKTFEGKSSPILYSDELNYLNANWSNWLEGAEFTSHRPVIGAIILKCKRALRRLLVDSLFREYFERERRFHMELVKQLNATARYVDSRDAELFWQLVQKVDNDIAGINERTDRLFDDAVAEAAARDSELANRIEQGAGTPGDGAASSGQTGEALLLETIPLPEHLPARWRETLERINRNTRRLNEILVSRT